MGIEPHPHSADPLAKTPLQSGDREALEDLMPSNHVPQPRVHSRVSSKGPETSRFPQSPASSQTAAQKHKKKPMTQHQIIAEGIRQQSKSQKCGACQEEGHVLANCTRKIDKYGFLPGCPRCNTRNHTFDDCEGTNFKKKTKPKLSEYWFWLVTKELVKLL